MTHHGIGELTEADNPPLARGMNMGEGGIRPLDYGEIVHGVAVSGGMPLPWNIRNRRPGKPLP